jgi:dihydrolipoamide dehydrogenase
MAQADLIVLGSGPGGYIAAIRAAQLGRTVTIVERESLGGVCLNWGCIPSKALLRSAQLFQDVQHAADFGFEVQGVKLNFDKVVERSRGVAQKLSGGVSYLMKKNKITVVYGNGKLVGKNQLEVTTKDGSTSRLTYKDIIIATGARPRPLPFADIDGEVIHSYRTLLDYRRLPKKTLVIGAGAIGIEFAYFHSSFGSEVTVVEMLDQILPVEDTEIAQSLEKILRKKGITIETKASVASLQRSGNTARAVMKTARGEMTWEGDCVLVAIGVIPNTENIGLDKVGIATDRGFVNVDNFMRTGVPNHYAIGDIVKSPLLAHVASHEGIVAAETACGHHSHGMSYDNIPSCTYCQPQVASIGLTERAAKEKGITYRVGKIPFSAIGKAIAIGEPEGMIKVIIDDGVGEVLGVHILHAEATELIAEAAVIRSHEGIAASVVDTIHPHPTISESVMEAMAMALGRPLNF